MQRATIQQAKQIDGISAFTGIVGLADDHTRREDNKRVWVLRGIG
jgi:hypothetical protein